jgi:membrane fusion protein, multidrug efflux system
VNGRTRPLNCGLLAMLVLGMAPAPTHAQQALSCLLEPSFEARLGSPAEGRLEEVLVDRSDVVRQGQLLARLDSSVERAALEYQRTRVGFAERRLDRSTDLRASRLISDQQIDELDTEAELARRELAEREALLALREIRSPVDGVIVDRFHNVGDIVHSERVFRLLRLDPLHVELVIPVVGFGNFRDGDQRQIRIPHLREVHTVRVINVDRVVDPGSNTFRVRLALPNPGLRIPSGLRCEMLE